MMLQSLLKELLQTVLWGDGTRHGMTSMALLMDMPTSQGFLFSVPLRQIAYFLPASEFNFGAGIHHYLNGSAFSL